MMLLGNATWIAYFTMGITFLILGLQNPPARLTFTTTSLRRADLGPTPKEWAYLVTIWTFTRCFTVHQERRQAEKHETATGP